MKGKHIVTFMLVFIDLVLLAAALVKANPDEPIGLGPFPLPAQGDWRATR